MSRVSDLDDFDAPSLGVVRLRDRYHREGAIVYAAVLRHTTTSQASRKRQGARASRGGFPAGWSPELTLRGSGGSFHVAGLYLGASTQNIAYYDASSRPVGSARRHRRPGPGDAAPPTTVWEGPCR